jgi:predicted AAA+ superfamily ATPase
MIKREQYLARLRVLRDRKVIKVVTGIRRCGKSTLLAQFQRELLSADVRPSQIIALNLEEMENEALLERHVLHDYVMRLADPQQMNYVFLDEVQNVPQFEKLVDSLFVKDFLDIYITGSNAYMLSSEIATALSGRYIEINILPFSFAEFSENLHNDLNDKERFSLYRQYGGFPEASNFLASGAQSEVSDYLRSIYHTVLLKDIGLRRQIRSPEHFENVLKFTLDSIGSPVSANKIAARLSAHQSPVNKATVASYILAMTDSFVLYRAGRYDIKGKELLETLDKYYAVDSGLAQVLLGKDGGVDRGHMLENIVYLELLRRANQVFVGKVDALEVDFVALGKSGKTQFYQVAETMTGTEVRARELAPLNKLRNHHAKYILTLDDDEASYDGIQQVNLIRWLLGK